MVFQVTIENVGRNGFTRRDVGKWAVMDTKTRVFYVRKTREECEEIKKLLGELK